MFLQNFDIAKYLSCRDLKDIFSMQKTEVQLIAVDLKLMPTYLNLEGTISSEESITCFLKLNFFVYW